MPFVRFVDGTDGEIKQAEAIKVWKVLTGEIEPNPKQKKFCDRIKKLYMSWRNPSTPDSYIEANKNLIFPVVLGSFVCKPDGRITRPEPGDKFIQEFCTKWGLTTLGRINDYGRVFTR